MLVCSRKTYRKEVKSALLSQLAEEIDLKSIQSRFESEEGYPLTGSLKTKNKKGKIRKWVEYN